jgi:hypothetical protein
VLAVTQNKTTLTLTLSLAIIGPRIRMKMRYDEVLCSLSQRARGKNVAFSYRHLELNLTLIPPPGRGKRLAAGYLRLAVIIFKALLAHF